MGTVSVNVPGPGTYQVKCDPNLDPLPDGGTAADVLEGKQFYRPDSSVVTGSMPDNTPEDVELEPGESYDIPRGYHSGAGRVAAPALTIDPAPVQGSGNPVASGGVYDALEGKQNKLTGTPGQVVGFNSDGNAVAQEAPDTGVTAFHGRTGAVQPMSGDYTAEMVGARPDTWTPTAAQVGAVPTSRKVNGKALSADISISAADVGAPTVAEMNAAIQAAAPAEGVTSFNGRKGAVTPASGDYTAAQVGAVPTTRTVNGKALSSDITLSASDISGIPDTSQFAPKESPVFTGSISLGRRAGSTVGENSIAIGSYVEAHAKNAYAEGWATTAYEIASHAEGYGTEASGKYSHAEGDGSGASGYGSHAEGRNTKARGYCSHTEGALTIAEGEYQHVCGVNNVSSTEAKLIIGKGSSNTLRANCFRVADTGVYASGNYNASGADYAEMFEWSDGNSENEDRAGLFVTLDGEKIRTAGPDDNYILGIVSGNPSVVGDVYDDQWQGMYLYDVFGRPLWEDVEVPDETIEEPEPDNPEQTITRVIRPAHTEHRQKLNPDYDNRQLPYIPRSERPEWDAVGLLGKLVAIDDGTCQMNGWACVGEGGKATRSEQRTRYRVMSRLDDTHIRIMIL